jgi:hypothetical protein
VNLPNLPLTGRTVARPTPELPDAPCCEEEDQDRKHDVHRVDRAMGLRGAVWNPGVPAINYCYLHGSEGYAAADRPSRAEGHGARITTRVSNTRNPTAGPISGNRNPIPAEITPFGSAGNH